MEINIALINCNNSTVFQLYGIPKSQLLNEEGDFCEYKIAEVFKEVWVDKDFKPSEFSWGEFKTTHSNTYMRKSEIYKEKALYEDNDLKAMGIAMKANREIKMENFIKNYLPLLKDRGISITGKPDSFLLVTEDKSLVEYYPKADRLHFHNSNTWTPKGRGLHSLISLFNL